MYVESIVYFLLWIIVSLFSVILQILISVSELSVYIINDEVGDRFDYVIVGGGSAGAVVAGRLSENPNVSVLLIEAGGEGFDLLNIPVLGPLKQLTDLDWQHETISQKYSCFGLENNVSKWPSGKVLGGSTHLNFMIYIRGTEFDYKTWKDTNSSHWSFKDIIFYFDKAMKCVHSDKNQKSRCNQKQHGSLYVREDTPYTTKLADAVLQAAMELGYNVNNLNSETNTGFMKPELNVNEFGKRYTTDQYLKSLKGKRKNLKIVTNALAEEILFRNNFEAYGVRYWRNGKVYSVNASLEVIVSAGAIGSPKLLLLSGVGPKHELEKTKISPKINLPVGKNLQDHVTTGLDLIILRENIFSFTDLLHPASAWEYFVHGRGPFTSGLVEAVGVIHSHLVDPLKESPDLEFMVLMAGLSSDKGVLFRNSMGISQKVWDNYFSSLLNESVVSIIPVLLHPKSRGEITLNPDDPKGKPKIDPKYLTEKEDVKTLIEGLKIVERMSETVAMKNFGVKFNKKKFPGCELLHFGSDEYWECYIRHLTLTVYHPVGTCKMAPEERGGVVDYRLRVHKTNKLRIIDASIMPTLPSANTNAAVVMIAEKGADLIKEDFSQRFSTCDPRDLLLNPVYEHPEGEGEAAARHCEQTASSELLTNVIFQ